VPTATSKSPCYSCTGVIRPRPRRCSAAAAGGFGRPWRGCSRAAERARITRSADRSAVRGSPCTRAALGGASSKANLAITRKFAGHGVAGWRTTWQDAASFDRRVTTAVGPDQPSGGGAPPNCKKDDAVGYGRVRAEGRWAHRRARLATAAREQVGFAYLEIVQLL
jgi:hypothetical protein